jgi:hypothetical protein
MFRGFREDESGTSWSSPVFKLFFGTPQIFETAGFAIQDEYGPTYFQLPSSTRTMSQFQGSPGKLE